MYIRTQRLILRDYMPTDWQDLHEIFSDPIVMADCEPPYAPEQTQGTLAYFIEKGIAYAATLADSGKVIGHMLFCQLPPPEKPGVYEIGWFFNRKFWRMGYAYEAAKALIDHGFRELKLKEIRGETIDPVKSTGLMNKLDMIHCDTEETTAPDGSITLLYWYAICNPTEETPL